MSQALWQALGHIKVNKKDPVREYVITPLILVQVFLILSVFFFFSPLPSLGLPGWLFWMVEKQFSFSTHSLIAFLSEPDGL